MYSFLILWSLTKCWIWLLPTGSIEMRLYEERMPTRWNHEEHDETNPMQATTIHRQSESKFVDKAWLKRRFFHLATQGRHIVRRRTYYMSFQMYTAVQHVQIFMRLCDIYAFYSFSLQIVSAPNSFVEHNRGQTSLFCQAQCSF